MNRLLFCEPWPVSKLTVFLSQFIEGIISLFVTLFCQRRIPYVDLTFPSPPSLQRLVVCRALYLAETCTLPRLGARFSRSVRSRRLGAVVALRRGNLFLLRPRSDRRLGVVGEDLGDAKHRDLVAI